MYAHKNGICVRKSNREDLAQLLDLKAESWWGTHNTLIANMDDQIRWYENLSDRELSVMLVKDSVPIGTGYFNNIDWLGRTMHVSGSIFKAHRTPAIAMAGFAAGLDFALEILNMFRVSAEVLECNAVAQRIHIHYLGFKVEGRRRKAVYKSGKYYDSIVLGLLREEWEQQDRIKGYGGSCNTNFDHNFATRLANRARTGILASSNQLPTNATPH